MDDRIQHQLQEFDPLVSGNGSAMTRLEDIEELQNVRGEDLHQVLPELFNHLYFEGNVDSSFSEYKRVLDMLQSNRRWNSITLSDIGMERASPDFLSLVVLAQTKTTEVNLQNCPLDRNFFACFNFGIQTLRILSIHSHFPISSEAASVLTNSLGSTTSLEVLMISPEVRFEDDDGGLKLAKGIRRNNSLNELIIHESSIGYEATKSILMKILEGGLPNLTLFSITLTAQSDCSSLVTKLMSSGKSKLEGLITGNLSPSRSEICWEEDDTTGRGDVNRRLKLLRMWGCSLDQCNLTWILPMVSTISSMCLNDCGISDLAPIIDFLRLPSCAVEKLSLKANSIGVDEVEKFVSCLGEMSSLTMLNMGSNPWCDDEAEEERINRIIQRVSRCFNLESFLHGSWMVDEVAAEYNLSFNLRTNRAWRRDLCYNKSSRNVPSNLFPLIAARALRRIAPDMSSDPSLGPSIIFALLQERNCDLIIE